MKTFKYILSVVLFITAVISCTEDEFGSDTFVSTAVAPTNITALFDVTPDNTGLITITPNSEGAVSYVVSFGDEAAESVTVKQGESAEHIFAEGLYNVKIVAKGITGLTAEVVIPLEVSFDAPKNLVVSIKNDPNISKKVNVIATADLAISFDVYFVEPGKETILSANNGGTASYVYAEAGTYTIRVVSKSAAIETTEYTEEFVVTEILQPLAKAPTPPSRADVDVISMFSEKYPQTTVDMFVTGWSAVTELDTIAIEENETLVYRGLNFAGIITEAEPMDASAMEYFHFDVWSTNVETFKIKFVDFNGTGWNGGSDNIEFEVENTITEEGKWLSFDIPLSDFEGVPFSDINQMVIAALPVGTVFLDNMYFWKEPSVVVDPNVIFDDFEGNGTVEWFEDGATLNNALVNPFIDGDNNSATVLEYNDNGSGQYANIQVRLGQKLDLTLGSVFSLKIYVPSSTITGTLANTLSLKLQNNELGGNAWSTQVAITEPIVLDAWQVVTFDFASAIDRTDLDQIVFQVNGEDNYEAVIAYIDDFSYGDSISSGTKLVVFDDFEGNGNITEWFEDGATLNDALANPFIDGDNGSATVLEYNDNGSGQYANIQVRLNEKFDLTTGSVFSLKIYVPSSTITGTLANTLSLKLQNNELGGNAWSTQVAITEPIVLDAWQVVTFDFVDAIDRTDLDQIVLQVNGEDNYEAVIAYIDDFNYNK